MNILDEFVIVDSLMENADVSAFAPGQPEYNSMASGTVAPAAKLASVCKLYKKVAPAINFAKNFFLLPKKWRKVLETFSQAMEALCPQ